MAVELEGAAVLHAAELEGVRGEFEVNLCLGAATSLWSPAPPNDQQQGGLYGVHKQEKQEGIACPPQWLPVLLASPDPDSSSVVQPPSPSSPSPSPLPPTGPWSAELAAMEKRVEERYAVQLEDVRKALYEQIQDVRQCSKCMSPSPPPPPPSTPPPPPPKPPCATPVDFALTGAR